MTILADASALVAIMTFEHDGDALLNALEQHKERLYCATGAWEAVRAIARIRAIGIVEADQALRIWCGDLGFRMVTIGDAENRLAIEAHQRYGKGTGHPAGLNMGDCFAYACAKANNARLLYKGDDFLHTDLA